MTKYIDADALRSELAVMFSDMNTNQYDGPDDALEDAAVTVRQAIYDAPPPMLPRYGTAGGKAMTTPASSLYSVACAARHT